MALIIGGDAIAAFLGMSMPELTDAILYEALPVFETGGTIYASPAQLANWQSGNLASQLAEPSIEWFNHMRGVLVRQLADFRQEAA